MPKPKPAHPPMRTRRVAAIDTSAKRVAKRTQNRHVRPDTDDLPAGAETAEFNTLVSQALKGAKRKAGQKRQQISTSADISYQRPDTDDPSQMMAAEAACGPLVDPIIDEDEDDETPGFGDTP